MPHATAEKFGYPASLINDGSYWCVLLRPAQVTLGSLVLVCKESATQFSTISDGAFAELGPMVRTIEATLSRFNAYDKINYLMLMMVDPHVHFHVIPRYRSPQFFGDMEFADVGWPGPPALQSAISVESALAAKLRTAIAASWKPA
jgi:diadenosine tetraphosphate (Ap4A) HIT family hydrolase